MRSYAAEHEESSGELRKVIFLNPKAVREKRQQHRSSCRITELEASWPWTSYEYVRDRDTYYLDTTVSYSQNGSTVEKSVHAEAKPENGIYVIVAQIAASLPCAVRSGMSDRLKKAENRGIRGKWFSMAYFCDILTNWKTAFG